MTTWIPTVSSARNLEGTSLYTPFSKLNDDNQPGSVREAIGYMPQGIQLVLGNALGALNKFRSIGAVNVVLLVIEGFNCRQLVLRLDFGMGGHRRKQPGRSSMTRGEDPFLGRWCCLIVGGYLHIAWLMRVNVLDARCRIRTWTLGCVTRHTGQGNATYIC